MANHLCAGMQYWASKTVSTQSLSYEALVLRQLRRTHEVVHAGPRLWKARHDFGPLEILSCSSARMVGRMALARPVTESRFVLDPHAAAVGNNSLGLPPSLNRWSEFQSLQFNPRSSRTASSLARVERVCFSITSLGLWDRVRCLIQPQKLA